MSRGVVRGQDARVSGDEELRELERRAREVDDAVSWSRLAFALARVGRGGEAQGAAHRALARDSEDAARALIATTSPMDLRSLVVPAVSWPGPCELHEPRRLTWEPLPRPLSSLLDAGQGLLVAEADGSDERLVALDVVTGRPKWVRPLPVEDLGGMPGGAVSRGRIVVVRDVRGARWESGFALHSFDPTTGSPVSGDFVSVPELAASTESIVTSVPIVLEDGGLVLATAAARAGRRALLAVDAEGRLAWERPIRDRFVHLWPIPGGVLVSFVSSTLVAFSLRGDEIWRGEGDVIAIDDERVLVWTGAKSSSELTWLDARTGRALVTSARLDCGEPIGGLTRAAVVLATPSHVLALDRATLRLLWRNASASRECELALTSDSVIRIEGEETALSSVTTCHPETGAVMKRVDVPTSSAGRPLTEVAGCKPVLVAGRLLVSSADGRPAMFQVGEPS